MSLRDAAAALVGLAIRLLLLGARPWRYAASAGFRQQFDRHYAGQGALRKWLALMWGTLIIGAAVAVVVTAVHLLRQP